MLTLINFIIVSGLLYLDYKYPEIIEQHYSDRQQMVIDMGSTYAVNIILILGGLGYIISNYTVERNRAESQVIILDQLNEEKSRIIQVVTHDFQTPLLNLKQYLKMISLYDIPADRRKQMEGEIARSIVNTQNLLINLLDLTKGGNRTEVGKSFKEFNVLEELKETILVYEDVAQTKNVKLDIRIPVELSIRSYPAMFSIAVRNLINNAVKIAPIQSEVIIKYREGEVHHQFSV
ncbi:hypothetical protein OKW96_16145 [Sphingobacterium sp. KU25419]|nr:hypothetical protein OKW96_16145 [Sphingobacterium sp. KU25419]